MNTPEKLEKTQIKWHRVPVDKAVMSKLTERNDAQGWWQFGGHLALVICTGALAFYSWYHWPVIVTVLLCYLHGTFYTFLGPSAAIHELSHKSTFKTPWLNDMAIRIVSFLTLWNFHHYRSSHVKHHQFTTYDDLDQEIIQPLTVNPMTWFNVFVFNTELFKMSVMNNLRYAFGKYEGTWEPRILPEGSKQRQEATNWARFVLVGNLILLAVFVYFKLWPLIVLVTLGSFIGNWLAFFVGFPQHAGLPSNVPDFRLCCRTFILHPFPSFLYWRMNYHIEHHMYPSVPCYHLGKLRQAMESHMPEAKIGLCATWKEIFAVLKRQKQEPGYAFYAQLPANDVYEEAGDESVLREARSEA
ncbi:fatty acid desaturase [Kamptonema cortianum]|nr:fatty acid desaturase [Kamptonema cortianum]MDL5044490.1 fatty acid desaturase [Oscillatoria amoena NRMC-F 0135]